jgi:hypothetical protein
MKKDSPSKLPKCPIEKCNDPKLGVILLQTFSENFMKIG